MTLRILLLSYYFTPDLAGFRVEALINALFKQPHCKVEIDLLTTQPNRYPGCDPAGEYAAHHPHLSITRIALPHRRFGLASQCLAFVHYAVGVHKAVKDKHYDLIVASSSRLMTAALAASIARKRHTPLYLDIRDIFVDVLPELFPGIAGKLLARLFYRVERFTLRHATQVNLISPGFLGYFSTRYPHTTFSFHTNGVDDLFLSPTFCPNTRNPASGPLKIVYAGNIGFGQGLEKILPQLAQRLAGKACFYVIGSGNTLKQLSESLIERQIKNVELIPPMPRQRLIHYYQQADVLFLHLNNFKAFLNVIPSKLFEYAATGKPILAGLDGFPKAFTLNHIANASVFTPTDADAAVAALAKLQLVATDRGTFIQEYSRASIQQRMAIDILNTANPK